MISGLSRPAWGLMLGDVGLSLRIRANRPDCRGALAAHFVFQCLG
jgi:hypothetical protein